MVIKATRLFYFLHEPIGVMLTKKLQNGKLPKKMVIFYLA